jgi:hypothetical protein
MLVFTLTRINDFGYTAGLIFVTVSAYPGIIFTAGTEAILMPFENQYLSG